MEFCPKDTQIHTPSSIGAGGAHDLGGVQLGLDGNGSIELQDHTLAHWELSIHALLVSLSSRSPRLLTTDELRRAVEALPSDIYGGWDYYERWAAGMTTILLERQVISQPEIDQELYGDEAVEQGDASTETQPIFAVGDIVQVKAEDSRLRWRRPHLRCPGYIYRLIGRIEAYMGSFEDPYLLAFRGVGPKQPLYVVSFLMEDAWNSSSAAAGSVPTMRKPEDFIGKDMVTAEIYQGWLEKVEMKDAHDAEDGHSHAHGHGHGHAHDHHDDAAPTSGCSGHHHDAHDGEHGHSHKHEHEHEHGHKHGHHADHAEEGTEKKCEHDHEHHDREDGHNHSHSHGHGHAHEHTHEARDVVEQRAVEREGVELPGKTLALALLRLLYKKQVITEEGISRIIDNLQNAGKKLLGAELVVRCWKDEQFKERLLRDAASAAGEVGINTSNPNAPTILRVVANTPSIHHVIVCTLCSCYPASLLGLSPAWYKSRNYRARVVREPRVVLKEFGLTVPDNVSIQVHDSTADLRYLVVPMPPSHLTSEDIARMSIDELKTFVTRDSMIGVAVL